MGTKIKCPDCEDIVIGDEKGHCITCKCGKTFIDETPDYCRISGDLDKILYWNEKTHRWKHLGE